MPNPLPAQDIFNTIPSSNRSARLLFIGSTVTAIISYSRSYYFFESYIRDSQGFSVNNWTSVLRKLSCLQQVENYIGMTYLEYQARERKYFQL